MRTIRSVAVGVVWIGLVAYSVCQASADPNAVQKADSNTNQKAGVNTDQKPDATATSHVLVVAVADDHLSIDVVSGPPSTCRSAPTNVACTLMHLVVTDNAVKDQLKQFRKGDHIQIVYSTDAKKMLKAWSIDAVSVPWLSRIWALLASAGACLFLYLIFSGFKPTQLIISEDNRYSNSRFQIAVWFFVVITTYIATLWLRVVWAGWDFIGAVDIPKNLLLLSGMSAFTYGGAKGITTGKIAAAGGTPKARATAHNFFFDLTHDDGKPAVPPQPAVAGQPAAPGQPAVPPQFDFGDFQMLIVTLIAVATYVVLVFNFFGTVEYSKSVSLPDVDTTILATLTKKAVGNVGTS